MIRSYDFLRQNTIGQNANTILYGFYTILYDFDSESEIREIGKSEKQTICVIFESNLDDLGQSGVDFRRFGSTLSRFYTI